MTVAVFVEAVDTIRALGWALLVWIVLLAVVAGVALYAVVVTVACACRAVWRGVAACVAAVQRLNALPEPQPAPEAPQPRPAPSWARTEHEEAA